jgi:hypothetical protein
MYRALAQTALGLGCAGLYLGYLPWPFADREYQILREAAFPEAHDRKDKIYLLQPREPGFVFEELLDYQSGYPVLPRNPDDEITDPVRRHLPVDLLDGETVSVPIVVSDDLDGARADGEMRKPQLTIRFQSFCVEDEIEIRLNGRVLDQAEAEITDERALTIAAQLRSSPVEAPMGMAAHWFRFKLDLDLLVRGENALEVETKSMSKAAGFTRSINGVEIRTRYREFERPVGLDVQRVAPG